jgi:O-antigen ligase
MQRSRAVVAGETNDATVAVSLIGWSLVAASIAAIIRPRLYEFDYLPLARTWIIYAVVGVTVGAVILNLVGRDMLSAALLAPFVSQYYQVVLGWEVPLGSSTPVRLVPLTGMVAIVLVELVRSDLRLTRLEMAVLGIWELACCLWLLNGLAAGPAPVAVVTWTFHAILLPALYFVLQARLAEPRSARKVADAILMGFVALLVASIAISFVALDYRGSASLLTARNANDGNIVLGYMTLAWPVAVLAVRRRAPVLVAPLGVLFIAAAVLFFSRGGLLVIPPLVVVTLLASVRRPIWTVGLLALGTVGAVMLWFVLADQLGLVGDWVARLNMAELDVSNLNAVFSSVQDQLVESGRSEIWAFARSIFSRSPIAGAGFNSFEALGSGYAEAHSLYYQTLAQGGLIGIIILYGLVARWIIRCLRGFRTGDGRNRSRVIQLASVFAWLIFTHAVGSGLVVTTINGLMVNVAGALLLILTLHGESLLPAAAA